MKNPYRIGDQKIYEKQVTEADFARFEAGLVHPVCSTFSLAQAAEWAGRLFVLEMKEEDEEGIGTMLTINHKSPAFEGETVVVTARIKEVEKNDVICSYEARVGERLVAEGETGQKVLKKEKIEQVFRKAKK